MIDGGTISIGLLWHSVNSGNLGVGALTVSHLALVREAAGRVGLTPQFTIIGPKDVGPAYVAGDDISVVSLDSRTLLSPCGYWRAIGPLDVVLDIGAGDSFADIYGNKRFGFLWLTKMIAALRGKPLLFSPQTVGPFTRQPHSMLAGVALRRATAIVARDPMSAEAARRLAPDARILQSVDVAFALPFTRHAGFGTDRLDVGINISGLLFNGGYGGRNDYGLQADYPSLMRRLIAILLDRADVRAHVVTHANAPHLANDDDSRVADQLALEFPGIVRVPDFRSPSDAKSYISGLDLLIGARMHACIAAYSAGVPVIPIAYSRKFTGLFEGVLDYRHVLPVTGLDTDGAVAFILDRIDRRAELKRDVDRGNAVVADLLNLYIDELERVFRHVAG